MIIVFRTFQIPGGNSPMQPFYKFGAFGSGGTGPIITDVQRIWAMGIVKHPL